MMKIQPSACRSLFALFLLFSPVLFAQPTITSFSPASGQAGTPVTINGSGFNLTPTANIVQFGAVRAIVTSATSSSLLVTMPAGTTYARFSVTNSSTGLTGYSTKPFITTFPNPFGLGIPNNFYKPAVNMNIAASTNRTGAVFHDIDIDGKPDLVISNHDSNTVSVFRNSSVPGSPPSFETKVSFTTGSLPVAVAVSDLDGDGKGDLVVANGGSNSISIYANMSTGSGISAATFASRTDIPAGFAPRALAIGDMDKDGRPDLVVTNSSGTFSVYRNITTVPGSVITFEPQVDFFGVTTANALALADFDGDNKLDIVVANAAFGNISLIRNNSMPGIITPSSFVDAGTITIDTRYPPSLGGVAVGDIDGDGKPDVAVCVNQYTTPKLCVLRNTSGVGNISFSPKVDYSISAAAEYVAIDDMDGDGKPDVVVNMNGIRTISLLRNTAAPGNITAASLAPAVEFAAGNTLSGLTLGDLDVNGIPEITTTQYSKFSILQVGAPGTATIPVINAISPDSSRAGTPVMISGTNFNPLPAANIVYFGAVKATVTGGSATSLTTSIPFGATYQPVSVLDTATHLTGFAAKPYVTKFTNPFGTGIPANYFTAPVTFSTAGYSFHQAIGDLNGDGKPDIVTANFVTRNISILINSSAAGNAQTPTFLPKIDILVGINPNFVTIGDLTGDGRPEIVVTNSGSSTISILQSTSADGSINSFSFNIATLFTSSGASFATISDLDSDGKPDIVAGNTGANSVSLFQNLYSTGTSFTSSSFGTRIDLPLPTGFTDVKVDDLDGDKKPDIVVSGANPARISLFRNVSISGSLSAFSFTTVADIAPLPAAGTLRITDLDGDGRKDLLLLNPSEISVFRNISTSGTLNSASFDARISYPKTGSTAQSFTTGDVDGDGKPDIITGNSATNAISILRNTSATGSLQAGSFAPEVSFGINNQSYSVGTGDLDGDGIPEVLVSAATGAIVFKANTNASLYFTPPAGPAGTNVTITGNFNPVAASNLVYFGAVKGTVTNVTATTLRVTAPAGATYQPLSVLNTETGLAAYSSQPFLLTFNNPFGSNIPGDYYKPKVDFTSGTGPRFITAGDLDNDGKSDLVTANFSANTISVFHNISISGSVNTSSFVRTDFATGTNPSAVVITDVDGDGKPDLVVANYGAGSVSVLRNTSSAGVISASSFAPAVSISTGGATYSFSVALGDIDRDGKPDMVVANSVSNTVTVFRNTSVQGTISVSSFAPGVNFATDAFPRFVTVADVDADGKPEIVVANQQAGNVSVLHNTASTGMINANSFAARVDFMTGPDPICIATGDLDGDGKPELIVSNNSSNTISVLRNTAATSVPSFAARMDFATNAQPNFVSVDDINGDGKPDIITANTVSNTVSVLRNSSITGSITASSFAGKVDFGTGPYPFCVTAGDLDGDGIAELATANVGGNSISVLKMGSLPPPVVTSFSPGSGQIGTQVTINGNSFNTDPASNTVYFGAVKATVTNATATSLTVTVPGGTTYQPLSVTNTGTALTGYAPKPFVTTFANPFGSAVPPTYYRPKVDFATGNLPYTVAFGDIDGDGKPDMVVANFNSNTISVLRNGSPSGSTTSASFSARTDITTGTNPFSVAISDLDGDGRPDIVVGNYGGGTVSVFRNTSVTSSGAYYNLILDRTDFTVGEYPFSIAVSDIDNDGRPDLIAASSKFNTLSVLRNTSTAGVISASSFAAKIDIATVEPPRFVAAGDLDNDGKADIVLAYERAGAVSVLRNNSVPGNISVSSFAAGVNFAVGASPLCVAISDLDGDGRPDLAVGNYSASTVSVLRNTAAQGSITAGSFAGKTDFATSANPYFITIGDVNGDGKPDIVSANTVSNTVSILRNTATAGSITGTSFAGKADFGAGGYPVCVAVGDLDGNGDAELACLSASSVVSVYKIGSASIPVISSLTPESGPTGTTREPVSLLKISSPGQAAVAASGTQILSNAGTADKAGIRLYPNPAKGAFTLELTGRRQAVLAIEVFTETGKTIRKSTINVTDKTSLTLKMTLPEQPAGVYYVKVTGAEGVQVAKLVLQR